MPSTTKTIKNQLKGRCLCGNITVKVQNIIPSVAACHCKNCRQWTAGPHFAIDCGNEIQYTGSQHIKTYPAPTKGERGFCNTCGTTLFYRHLDGGRTLLSADLFEDQTDFSLDLEIYVDEQPNYYSFNQKTIKLRGDEVDGR